MGNCIDLAGKKYGRLTILEKSEPGPHGASKWKCRCDCGKEVIVWQQSLRSGKSQSCGCLRKDVNTIHGGRKTRLYRIWDNMKSRCYNPTKSNYKDYGGRGITVCPEWLSDFGAFQRWAMAHGYRDDLTIDRIDNDKGYSHDNCHWVTVAEQSRNKRSNHKITYKAETKTVDEWAAIFGLAPGTLYSRISRGWDIERALTSPAS